ncbi:MAG: YigZ family protein [Tenericutes bacterium HGW-Tenericutes-6]|nr:MAG: YigZ family protein [Tenericutes bacterium HGW-Tenericutes-6]
MGFMEISIICYTNKGDDMKYINEITTHQIEIDKSKFIGVLMPISNEQDIESNIEKVKNMYPKGNHYCYAAIYGEQATYAKMSDDGEPSRTAGAPIMEVLKHHDLTNVLCVVVRYFGGIKLGQGGLVRAYTKATSLVLQKTSLYEKAIHPIYELIFDYPLIQKVDNILLDAIMIKSKSFLDVVRYEVVLNDETYQKIDEILYHLKGIKYLGDYELYVKI